MKILHIFTDGASRGNPGKAAIAFTICDANDKVIEEYSEYIGNNVTNNKAEYLAIIKVLDKAASRSKGEIFLFSDSELVIGHLDGSKKVKKSHLKELYLQVKKKEKMFKKVTYSNLSREDSRIKRVDKLVNEELDRLP